MVLSGCLGVPGCGNVSPAWLGGVMGSWCLAWALDGMRLERRGFWWVVGGLGRMGYPFKLVCEMALDKFG